MTEPPVRVVLGDGDPDLDALLSSELDGYNRVASGQPEQRELTVRLTDDGGSLLAGLSGWTWGACAGWAMVWVREDQRGTGLGRRLLQEAEVEAVRRGCDRAYVSSFTFQAPGFYAGAGYEEVARVPDLPVPGAADVHLRKRLGP